MSKRSAFNQITKDAPYSDGSDRAEDVADAPQKATAAQMAARKIRQAKSRGRPGGSPMNPSINNSPFNTGTLSTPGSNTFGFGAASADTPQVQQTPGFAFGQQPQPQQQPGNGVFGLGGSSSFPPTNGISSAQPSANASFRGFGSGGFNFGGAAQPSGGFTFGTGGGSNPFASANAGPNVAQAAPTSGGFAGSIFNIPASQPITQQTPPVFGKPSAENVTPASNVFGAQTTATSQQRQPLNVFGQFPQGSKNAQSVFAANQDAMQTSPDPSPQKIGEQDAAPFSAGNRKPSLDSPTKQPSQSSFNPFLGFNKPAATPSSTSPTPDSETAAPVLHNNSTASFSQPPSFPLSQPSTQPSQIASSTSESPQSNPFASIQKATAPSRFAPSTSTSFSGAFSSPAKPPAAISPAPSFTPTQSTAINMFGKTNSAQLSGPLNENAALHVNGAGSKSVQHPTVQKINNYPPAHFTATQEQEYNKAVALNTLNTSLRKHLASANANADWSSIMEYYISRREQLLRNVATQRSTNGVGKNLFTRAPAFGNSANIAAPPNSFGGASSPFAVNGVPLQSQAEPVFGSPNKRKADDDPSERDLFGSKKSKGDGEVSYPTLPSSEAPKGGSQTSNLFRSILEGNDVSARAEETNTVTKSSAAFQAPAASQSALIPFPPVKAPSFSDAASFGQQASRPDEPAGRKDDNPTANPFTIKPTAPAPWATGASSPFKYNPSNTGRLLQATETAFEPNQVSSGPASSAAPFSSPFQLKPSNPGGSLQATETSFQLKQASSGPASSAAPFSSPFQLKPSNTGGSMQAAEASFKPNQASSGPASSATAFSSPFQLKPSDTGGSLPAPETSFQSNQASSGPASSAAPFSSPFQLKPSNTGGSLQAPETSFQSNQASSGPASSAAPFSSPFKIQPSVPGAVGQGFASSFKINAAQSSVSAGNASSSAPQPPQFSTGTKTNFFAQFGKAAEETTKKDKAKRKAEDFDSDEEDEADWERKDAEEQATKRAKLAEFTTGSQPPKFGTAAAPNFLAQFGNAAEESAKREKAKRKAEDFDSDEDDEAEWERKDAEEQAAKRAKLAELTNVAEPPKFGGGAAPNFFAQFGKTAEEIAKKEKEKRKAEDCDSDEDDEAEWERKDAEEQAAKKAKLAELTKKAAKFVPGKGFVFEDSNSDSASKIDEPVANTSLQVPTPKAATTPAGSFNLSRTTSPLPSTTGGSSVFSYPRLGTQSAIVNDNIFGHLSDVESGAEGSKTGDADDEESSGGEFERDSDEKRAKEKPIVIDLSEKQDESEAESMEDATKRAKGRPSQQEPTVPDSGATSERSLFDRIRVGADGKPERDESSAESKPADNTDPRGATEAHDQPAGQDEATPKPKFGSVASPVGDQTWKPDSPIKFAGTSTAPSFSITAATPTKPADDAVKEGTPASRPFSHLFGTPSGITGAPNTFGSSRPFSSFAPPKLDGAADVGFSFGGPPRPAMSLLAPTANASATSSRATSPGVTTDGGDSADDAPATPQVDLTALTDAERAQEELLFEVARAKCTQSVPAGAAPDAKPQWVARGLGPLRVLKNRDTGIVRLVMRVAPNGKVVLNSRLLEGVRYERPPGKEKMVQFAVVGEKGGALVRTVVLVGRAEDAERLVGVCEEWKGRGQGGK